jgi:hypothetical protein
MQKYKQYCPVARASEILADRWTPLIVRELILGSHRFNFRAGSCGVRWRVSFGNASLCWHGPQTRPVPPTGAQFEVFVRDNVSHS